MQERASEAAGPRGRLTWGWAGFLSFATALVAVGSVTLHLVGSIWHRKYLEHWGIDAKLFPQSTDQVLLTGFYALFDRLLLLFWALVDESPWVLLAVAILFVLILCFDALTDRAAEALIKFAHGWRPWQRWVGHGLLVGVGFTAFAILATFVLVVLMGIPAAAAEMAAKKSAEEHAADFAKGCVQSKQSCVEVRRSGQAPVLGYMLESSPSHLAVFDAGMKRGRTLARDGVEVVVLNTLPLIKSGTAPPTEPELK